MTEVKILSDVIAEGHRHFWIFNTSLKARHYGWRMAYLNRSNKVASYGSMEAIEVCKDYLALPIIKPAGRPAFASARSP